jgi:hypothetical protein
MKRMRAVGTFLAGLLPGLGAVAATRDWQYQVRLDGRASWGMDDDLAKLHLLHRFRSRTHGYQVAHTPRADAGLASGLWVKDCPEHAITLQPTAR